MTATRHPGTSPVFRHFRELAGLPPDEQREALMERLEHVWDEAHGRSYVNKYNDIVANPDTAVMLKVVQAVAVLQGLTGKPDEADETALGRMTDADLVREATKRLPPAQVAELADALIELREQQRSKQAIVTTGETQHVEKKQQRSKPRGSKPKRDGGGKPAVHQAAKPRAKWV